MAFLSKLFKIELLCVCALKGYLKVSEQVLYNTMSFTQNYATYVPIT